MLTDTNIIRYSRLPTPRQLETDIPLTEKAQQTVVKTREDITNILKGTDTRKLIVVGPCSLHDTDQALEYAKRLRDLQEEVKDHALLVMRTYFEKPRTTIGWKGYINDPDLNGTHDMAKGLSEARRVLLAINEMGVACATEFLDPRVSQYTADLISWAAIGARTSESQPHRELASGLSMPIGFKNVTQGDVKPAIQSLLACSQPHVFAGIDKDGCIAKTETKGNSQTHIILRGGTQGSNYDRDHIKNVKQILQEAGIQPRIMVDCNHGNSGKNPDNQEDIIKEVSSQIAQGEDSVFGFMIESNIKSGNQKLTTDADKLEYGVSITDPCLGWDNTRKIILEACETFIKQIPIGTI